MTCAVCLEPMEGIPYGPLNAECCLDCWMKCGSYGNVRLAANGPDEGDEVKFEVDCWPLGRVGVVATVERVSREDRTARVRIYDLCGKLWAPELKDLIGDVHEMEWSDLKR